MWLKKEARSLPLPQGLWHNSTGLPQSVYAECCKSAIWWWYFCYLSVSCYLFLCFFFSCYMLNKAMHSRSEAWMALMDHSPYGAVAYYTEGCNILCKSHNIEFMYTWIRYLLHIQMHCVWVSNSGPWFYGLQHLFIIWVCVWIEDLSRDFRICSCSIPREDRRWENRRLQGKPQCTDSRGGITLVSIWGWLRLRPFQIALSQCHSAIPFCSPFSWIPNSGGFKAF